MTSNLSLRIAILQSGLREYRIAKAAGMAHSKFSHIKNGVIEPSAADKRAIAKALKRPVAELFPSIPDEASA